MAWVRLDDGYPEHPKVDRVGPLAAWLNVCAWAYCARNLTDGFVPAERVPRLASVERPQKLAAVLVEANLWEQVDGGYQVHDYLAYNPRRETVLKERSATAKRVAEWRGQHGTNGSSNGVTGGVTEGVTNSVGTDAGNASANGVSTPCPVPIPSTSRVRIPVGDSLPPAPSERPPTRHGKLPKTRQPISTETIERLVSEYGPQFGDEQLVRDWIARALNHTARLKALDEALYVERTWLKPELEKLRAHGGPPVAVAEAPLRAPEPHEQKVTGSAKFCDRCKRPHRESGTLCSRCSEP